MKRLKVLPWVMWSLACMLAALPSLAADYPAPQEGSWVVRDGTLPFAPPYPRPS